MKLYPPNPQPLPPPRPHRPLNTARRCPYRASSPDNFSRPPSVLSGVRGKTPRVAAGAFSWHETFSWPKTFAWPDAAPPAAPHLPAAPSTQPLTNTAPCEMWGGLTSWHAPGPCPWHAAAPPASPRAAGTLPHQRPLAAPRPLRALAATLQARSCPWPTPVPLPASGPRPRGTQPLREGRRKGGGAGREARSGRRCVRWRARGCPRQTPVLARASEWALALRYATCERGPRDREGEKHGQGGGVCGGERAAALGRL
eukprot:365100-Chlamydomonas_euryale.AAC.16